MILILVFLTYYFVHWHLFTCSSSTSSSLLDAFCAMLGQCRSFTLLYGLVARGDLHGDLLAFIPANLATTWPVQ